MRSPQPKWKRYQELRPDELAEIVRTFPIVFWPLGLLEHHGWHLPVRLDGLKAEHIKPTAWGQGTGGGHGVFHWTHYSGKAFNDRL